MNIRKALKCGILSEDLIRGWAKSQVCSNECLIYDAAEARSSVNILLVQIAIIVVVISIILWMGVYFIAVSGSCLLVLWMIRFRDSRKNYWVINKRLDQLLLRDVAELESFLMRKNLGKLKREELLMLVDVALFERKLLKLKKDYIVTRGHEKVLEGLPSLDPFGLTLLNFNPPGSFEQIYQLAKIFDLLDKDKTEQSYEDKASVELLCALA